MSHEHSKSGAGDRDDESTYRQAKAIALAALDRPAAERDRWARAQCQDDADLWAEVGWLLEAAEDESDDDIPDQFQRAAGQVVREVSLTIPLPRDYRLIRRLDGGGSGTVYLAERIDGNLRQPVALKLLRLTARPDEEMARRFDTERQILARLSHPNIARLIDAGLTAEGRPFLATEFVDGKPIDRWCQEGSLAIRDRIRLFMDVLDAVDYAHRHMVIHRDLKPGNILVSAEGGPRLLDFGIARLLDEPGSTVTEPTEAAMTLAYASPEQIRGEGLQAATDVYSLGVVLYELLTGQRPHARSDSPHQLSEAILAGRIEPPSEHLQASLPRSLKKDLDAIVAKALRGEAGERYLSVRDFAQDLQRLLDHRPVQARRGHLAYRARRYAWRHRFGLSAAAALLVLVVAFVVDREAQLKRIAWERDRAEAITEFLSELFAGADSLPSRGNEVTVREILDLGASQLEGTQGPNPAFTGSIHLALGSAYNALGLGEQALPLLSSADQTLSSSASLAEQALIQSQIAGALDTAGRAAEAIAADSRAIELYRTAEGDHERTILGLRIRQLRNQANVLDRSPADSLVEMAAIVDQLETGGSEDGLLLFEARAALVGIQVTQGEADAALATATRALELAESLWQQDDPRRLRARFVHATALMLSNPDAAIARYRALIADHQRLVGPGQRLANTIGNFGVALSRVGRVEESMQAFEESASMIEQVAGRDHYLYRLSMSNLAALNLRQNRPQQAEAMIAQILPDLARRATDQGGIESVYYASALDILASALSLQNRSSEAAEQYRAALAALENRSGPTIERLRETLQQRLSSLPERS